LRVINLFIVVVYIILLASCVPVPSQHVFKSSAPAPSSIATFFKGRFPVNASITRFEQHIPDSPIILHSTICFSEDYQKFHIYGVKGSWIQDNLFVIFRNGQIDSNFPFCHKLSANVTGICSELVVSHNIVGLVTKDKICFYELSGCGSTVCCRLLSNKIFFCYPYIIFVKDVHFAVELYGGNRPFWIGSVNASISKAVVVENQLILLCNTGRLVDFDLATHRLMPKVDLPDNITDMVICNGVMVAVTKDNFVEFMKVAQDGEHHLSFNIIKRLGPYKHICLALHTPYVFANGDIIGLNVTKRCDVSLHKFDFANGLLVVTGHDSLIIIKLHKIYYQRIIFDRPDVQAFRYKKEILIHDVDGVYRILDTKGHVLRAVRKHINIEGLSPLRYFRGALYDANGCFICRIAKIVKSNHGWYMLKRDVGNRLLFYFEPESH